MSISITIDNVVDYGTYHRITYTVTSNEATVNVKWRRSPYGHTSIGYQGYYGPIIKRVDEGTISGAVVEDVTAGPGGTEHWIEIWASADQDVVDFELEKLRRPLNYTARLTVERVWFDRGA